MAASGRPFPPGDVVSAEYAEGQWYLATVDQALGDENYLVSWLDGDTSNRLRHGSEMRPMRFNRATQAYEEVGPADAGPRPGDAAEAQGTGRPAAPARIRSGEESSIQQLPDETHEEVSEVVDEDEQILEVGDRVELVDLQTRPELCGLTGTVVDKKDGRWRVNVDAVGYRLLHARNLQIILVPGEDAMPLEMEEEGQEMGQEMEQADMVEGEEGEFGSWDGLQPGVIVKIAGLRKQADMNGLFGALVETKDENWLVQVEGREEPVELSSENFTRVEAEDDVYEQPWERDFEPPPCYMFGSWDEWAGGHMMNWDPARSCLQYILELGSEAQESFRILIDGDLDQQLHPDCENADPYTGFQVLGPGKNDDGLNWTIGRHPLDEAVAGAKYEVRLFIGRAGFYRIDWVLLNKYRFGQRTKPQAQKKSSASSRLTTLMPPNRATLKIILQAARPSWSAVTLDSVMEKLARVNIQSGVALIEALQNTEHGDLNSRLKEAGEKAFTTETLEAMRDRGSAWENDVRMRENAPMKELDIQVFKFDDRPSDGMSVMDPDSLPVQVFKVVSWKTVFVRERPCANSPAIGTKQLHEEVRSKEQSFDGYVKLLGEPGWILRDTGDEQGLGRVLDVAQGDPLPLLIEELAERSGPQKFAVTRQGRGVIRVAPDDAAPAIAFKHAGEPVYIDTQTYNGWLRVSADEPSNGGWMLPNDPDDGQLLRCQVLEDRQERKRSLRKAREVLETMSGPSPDTASLRAALALAKDAGMDREELKAAEAAFEQVLKREEREREMQRLKQCREDIQKLVTGEVSADAKTLQSAISRAKAAGMDKDELSAIDAKLQAVKKDEEAERKVQAKKKHLQHRIQTSAGNVRLLRGCIHDGNAAGLTEEIALAESMLEKAMEQEKEAARNALCQRIQVGSGKEKELLAVKSEAEAAGFHDVVALAEKAIGEAVQENKSTAATHEVLLAAVTAAAASNDKDEIKKAREAAKKAGIPIKLIAKAYAMGQNSEN